MNDDKKHIDRLFQEKLKDFEAKPSSAVWNNIQTQMEFPEKDIRVVPLWAKLSGIAVGLLLLFTLGNTFLNSSKTKADTNQVVETKTNTTEPNNSSQNNKDAFNLNSGETKAVTRVEKEESTNKSLDNESPLEQSQKQSVTQKESQSIATSNTQNESEKNDQLLKNETKNKAQISENALVTNTATSKEKITSDAETNHIIKDAVLSEKAELADNTVLKDSTKKVVDNDKFSVKKTEDSESGLVKDKKNEDIQEAIAAAEDLEEDAKEIDAKINRWGIAPNIAPVYFNTLGTGSSINEQFNDNKKTGEVNMSYGILSSYAINNKLSVRAGVNKVNLGYKTNNIIVYNNVNPQPAAHPLRNLDLSYEGQQLSFISAENFAYAQVPNIISDQINGSIDQKLGFIEVPLEVEYKISDRKMGLRLIGGFSTFFLNENEVYSNFDGKNTYIGEATNINNTSYSANLGLGLDFKLSKQFNLNLEPTFKYQINTFNNTTGNFNPFIVGVYTGIRYKF